METGAGAHRLSAARCRSQTADSSYVLGRKTPKNSLAKLAVSFHDREMNMDGTIVTYAADEGTGVINAHDGKSYHFAIADWPYPKIIPEAGLMVTFEPAGTTALKIKFVGRAILMK